MTAVPSAREGADVAAAAAHSRLRARIVAGLIVVYLLWGSTYLAIRIAIETIPPFLMAGARFVIAGTALYAWARSAGAARATWREWRAAAIVGGLLLVSGNGIVVWSEQRVISGTAALIVASVAFWMVVLEWLRPRGTRPSGAVIAGLVVGLTGVLLLVEPGTVIAGHATDPIGAALLVGASLSWATGSLYSRHAPLPRTPILGTAMQMLAGGTMLLVVAAIAGEPAALAHHAPSARSIEALLYLVVFGSGVGYTTYIWLLRAAKPAHVATYAYVNPMVAVFLGWAMAGEPLTPRTILAAVVIVSAVAMITARRRAPG